PRTAPAHVADRKGPLRDPLRTQRPARLGGHPPARHGRPDPSARHPPLVDAPTARTPARPHAGRRRFPMSKAAGHPSRPTVQAPAHRPAAVTPPWRLTPDDLHL